MALNNSHIFVAEYYGIMNKSPPPLQHLNSNPTNRLGPTHHTWQRSQRGRSKPKRLRNTNFLCDSDDDRVDNQTAMKDSDSDIYVLNNEQFVHDVYFKKTVRPLPAISTMLAIAPQQRGDGSSNAKSEEASGVSNIPILKKFMDSLSKAIPNASQEASEGDKKAKGTGNDDDKSDSILDQISTVLTQGHHAAFRRALAELDKDGLFPDDKTRKRKAFTNRRPQRKEFYKLCDLFQEERRLYAIALEKFKIDNANRFLSGFRGEYYHSSLKVFSKSNQVTNRSN